MESGLSELQHELDSEFEPGYAEECDSDAVLSFERAADMLVPDISLDRMMDSIKSVPLPTPIDPNECIIHHDFALHRPDIHFSESELRLFKLSAELGLGRQKLKAVIETISNESFNVQDVSWSG